MTSASAVSSAGTSSPAWSRSRAPSSRGCSASTSRSGTGEPVAPSMLFEQLRAGGCLSYVIGCEKTCAGVIVDPALDLVDRYVALTVEKGLRIRYVIDSHTHADHFSAARELARQLGARIVMHRRSATPF